MSIPSENQSTKPPAGRPLLTVPQVMSVCRVSRRSVYNWMNDNKVQWAQGLTRRYIYADSIPLLQDFKVTEDLTVYSK